MIKKLILTALLCSHGLLFAAPVITNQNSYGLWKDKQNEISIKVSATGFGSTEAGNPGCRMKYETTKISGKTLLREIKESIESEFSEPKGLNPVIKQIVPNQQYTKITGYYPCADGSESFIYVANKTGFHITTGPEDSYSAIYKK